MMFVNSLDYLSVSTVKIESIPNNLFVEKYTNVISVNDTNFNHSLNISHSNEAEILNYWLSFSQEDNLSNQFSQVSIDAIATNTQASFTTQDTTEYDSLIIQVQSEVQDSLTSFVNQENYDCLITNTFDNQWNSHDLKLSINNYLQGIDTPKIQIITTDDEQVLKGAFSVNNNTIYLEQGFLQENINQVTIVKDVLIEELGHFFQSQNSDVDIEGDEGELLSNLVTDKPLTDAQIAEIKQENDRQLVLIDKQLLLIEKASLAGTEELVTVGEDSDTIIQIPEAENRSFPLIFNYGKIEGTYQNEIGVFLTDENGNVDGVAPTEANYTETVLNSSSRQIIFNGDDTTGNWREIEFVSGSNLAFYLVSNDSSQAYLDAVNNNATEKPDVFFSIQNANDDGLSYVTKQDLGAGIWQLNWEDLLGGGDLDYNDVVFTVNQKGIKAPGNESQTTPLQVEFASSQADYNNEIGLFLVDDADGTINGIAPGDSGYVQQVFQPDNFEVVFTQGNPNGSRDLDLEGGQYIGWYLISDNTTAEFLQTNPDNNPNGETVAFFSYAQANPDELYYLNYNSSSQLAWEDMLGGGDLDYNDFVFNFNFGTPRDITTDITIAVEDVSIEEENEGVKQVQLTVTLSQEALETVTVDYATSDDTAIANQDYQPVSGSLSFAPGEVEKTIAISILGDVIDEIDELFNFELSNADNAVISDGIAEVTIIDDDTDDTSVGITADIANDTGIDDDDRITFNPTINGETENATTLLASFNGDEFVDLTEILTADGNFTLGIEQYSRSNQ